MRLCNVNLPLIYSKLSEYFKWKETDSYYVYSIWTLICETMIFVFSADCLDDTVRNVQYVGSIHKKPKSFQRLVELRFQDIYFYEIRLYPILLQARSVSFCLWSQIFPFTYCVECIWWRHLLYHSQSLHPQSWEFFSRYNRLCVTNQEF